jgi:hypothetical protein
MTDHVERFKQLFRGRESCYGQYREKPQKPQTLPGIAPDEAWANHLAGKGPYLGIVPIRQDNTCAWGAIDIDDDGVDLHKVVSAVEGSRLPLIVCRSKSGGAHLYVFFKDTVPAKTLQKKLKEWAAAIGFENNHDGRPVEVFPKQGKLKPDQDGNWINLPYYDAVRTNRFAVGLAGNPLTLDEFLYLAEARLITSLELDSTAAKSDGFFGDGPPCLQTLHNIGFPEGSRNVGLFNVAIYLKLKHGPGWETHLKTYNEEKCDPPMHDREIETIAGSVNDKTYSYRCGEAPIQPHCKHTKCKKQKFGIRGVQRDKAESDFPLVADLVKVMTDPPCWQVKVNNIEVQLQTDDLMSLQRFRKAVLEKINFIVPMLRPHEWDEHLETMLKTCTVIDAPEDAGTLGQFQFLFGEFLKRRSKADTRDDILRGLPYGDVDENKVYFRGADLYAWLASKNFGDYTANKVYDILRRWPAGSGYKSFTMKGAKTQCWWVTMPMDEQSENFSPLKSAEPVM